MGHFVPLGHFVPYKFYTPLPARCYVHTFHVRSKPGLDMEQTISISRWQNGVPRAAKGPPRPCQPLRLVSPSTVPCTFLEPPSSITVDVIITSY